MAADQDGSFFSTSYNCLLLGTAWSFLCVFTKPFNTSKMFTVLTCLNTNPELLIRLFVTWNYDINRNNMSENLLLYTWLSLQVAYCWKYSKVVLNIFEISQVKEIRESWLVYVSKFSWIMQSCFLTKTIKRS